METISRLNPAFMAEAGDRVLGAVLNDSDTLFIFDTPKRARNFVSRASALRVQRKAPWHLVTMRVNHATVRCALVDTAPITYCTTEEASSRFTAEWRNTLYERIRENAGHWTCIGLDSPATVARAHNHINNHKKRRRKQHGFSKWDDISIKRNGNEIGFYAPRDHA